MKTIRFIIILSLALFYGAVYAQSAYSVTGKWTVNVDKTLQNQSFSKKQQYADMPTEAQANMRQSFQGRTFEFADNQKATVNFYIKQSPRSIQGVWSYEPSTKTLTITVRGQNSVYNVDWETTNNMRLVYAKTSASGLIESLYLTRSY